MLEDTGTGTPACYRSHASPSCFHSDPSTYLVSDVWRGEGDYAYALIQTTDGGYALAGQTYSYGAGEYADCWLVKTEGLDFSNTSTKTEGLDFPIIILWYLVIVVSGSSVGLLASRLVYWYYKKRR